MVFLEFRLNLQNLGEICLFPVILTEHFLLDFCCRPWWWGGGYFLEQPNGSNRRKIIGHFRNQSVGQSKILLEMSYVRPFISITDTLRLDNKTAKTNADKAERFAEYVERYFSIKCNKFGSTNLREINQFVEANPDIFTPLDSRSRLRLNQQRYTPIFTTSQIGI